jgi:hypothetical protein
MIKCEDIIKHQSHQVEKYKVDILVFLKKC